MAVLQIPQWAIRREIVDPLRPRKTPSWTKWHLCPAHLTEDLALRYCAGDTFVAKAVCDALFSSQDDDKVQMRAISALVNLDDFCQECLGPLVPVANAVHQAAHVKHAW